MRSIGSANNGVGIMTRLLRQLFFAGLCTVCFLIWVSPSAAEEPVLIPRKILFGNPEKTNPQLSPDGKMLTWIAPDDGVLNVWVRGIGKEDDRVVTRDRKRGIRNYFWAQDNRHILYVQDRDGDENWHLYSVDLNSRAIRDLSPFEGIRVSQILTDENFPNELLFGMNLRDERIFDLYRCNLTSGGIKLEAENPGRYLGWIPDHDFQVRGAFAAVGDGGNELLLRQDTQSEFEPFLTWGPEDRQNVYGFTPDNQGLYLSDSVESDTTRLFEIDIADKIRKAISHDPDADTGPVLMHPTEHHLQAVGWYKDRLRWRVLDESIAEDFNVLETVHPGEMSIVSRDLADERWLVRYVADTEPLVYYLYDRATRKATYMFTAYSALSDYTLVPIEPVVIKSRDGLSLQSYLTLPPGKESRNLPLVLDVHGGPWGRDRWGYNSRSQWFANRGYATLKVNFRGSAGFGKRFLNAGNREWAGKMHDDLIDGVNWAIGEGIADPDQICIFGMSYGGYAALVGLTFTPDVFACGVDGFGPSNIVTLLKNAPPYWANSMPIIRHRVGNEETEADFLESRSPLFKADRIRVPLLIGQGANDVRVTQVESDQIVAAMRKNNKPVEYLLFPDEGHGFARPENRLKFYAAAEQFLAKYLGGRAEPASEEENWESLRK